MKSVKAMRKFSFLEDATEEVLATGLDPFFVDEPEHVLDFTRKCRQFL